MLMINTREIVLELLISILEEGKFSHIVLNRVLKDTKDLEKQDRRFITRLCEGTVERVLTLDLVIAHFSKVKLSKMKPVIRNILRMSVYQILYMDQIPVSAACNEAVKLAGKRGFRGLGGFVNGILRNIARTDGVLDEIAKPMNEIGRLSFYSSVPRWIVEVWVREYGSKETGKLLDSFYEERMVSLRINLSKTTKTDLCGLLQKNGIHVEDGKYLDCAVHISGYDTINLLPGFEDGLFQVQDESSMLVGLAAGVKEGDVCLDVCAAPGGKSLHLADLLCAFDKEKGKVIARDISLNKVGLIQENINRAGFHNIYTEVRDALLPIQEDEEKADIVLADLPCSGLGILSKKPDIRLQMTEEKEQNLVDLQRRILINIVNSIKPGGILIYSTCTIHPSETIEQVNYITKSLGLTAESLNDYLPKELHNETTCQGYLQLLPSIHETDGFFLARMRKRLPGV